MTKDTSLQLITKSMSFTKITKAKSYQILRLISKRVTKKKTESSKKSTESGKWGLTILIIYLFWIIRKDTLKGTLSTQVGVKPKREINKICHHLLFLGHVNRKKINMKLNYKKVKGQTSKEVQKLKQIKSQILRKAGKKYIKILPL